MNNINSFYNLPKIALSEKLIELGFNPNIRSEELSLNEISAIYCSLFEGDDQK